MNIYSVSKCKVKLSLRNEAVILVIECDILHG